MGIYKITEKKQKYKVKFQQQLLIPNLFVIIIGVVLLLCSCSSDTTIDEVQKKTKSTISDIAQMKAEGLISTPDYDGALKNIMYFEQQSFVEKYWYIVIVLLIWSFIFYLFIAAAAGRNKMKSPASVWKKYVVTIIFGFLGGHYFYLNKFKWIGYITMVLWLALPIWFFKEIMYFYDIPYLIFIRDTDYTTLPHLGLFYTAEVSLLCLSLLNILIGLVCTPFWTYLYNGKYFRQHVDNDAILQGKKLKVDIFYEGRLIPNIKKTNKDADYAKQVLSDEDFIMYDESDEQLSGFFKAIVTLGSSSTLKHKVGRLRALRQSCLVIKADIKQFESDNNKLYDYLSYYRIAAYRNLYLAKELIGIVKDKVSSKQQILIKDEFPEILAPKMRIHGNVSVSAESISFDSDSFFDSVRSSLSRSFEDLSSKMEKEGNISKDDFIDAAVMAGIETVIAGVEEILNMNSRTSEAIRDVECKMSRYIDYLEQALPSIISYQAELSRQSEIMVALNQCNKAFVLAYEPLRAIVFGRPTFRSFIYGMKKDYEKINSDDFRKQLLHLIQVCTEYNRIYNAQTGNDIGLSRTTNDSLKEKQNIVQNSVERPFNIPIRQQILDIVKDNTNKYQVVEHDSVKVLGLHKSKYGKKALCIRLNETFKTELEPEDFQSFIRVGDIIDYVIKNKKI